MHCSECAEVEQIYFFVYSQQQNLSSNAVVKAPCKALWGHYLLFCMVGPKECFYFVVSLQGLM